MVIASSNCENISVFAFLCSREKFSAQPKGLLLRNKRNMPRKIAAPATFSQKGYKGRRFECHHIFLKDAEVEGSVLLPPTFPEEKVTSAHYTRFADMFFSTVNSK